MTIDEKICEILDEGESNLTQMECTQLINFFKAMEFQTRMRLIRSPIYEETIGIIEYLHRTEKISESIREQLYKTLRQAARIQEE